MVAGIVVGAGAAALGDGYQLRDWAHGLQQVAEQERGGLGALELDRSIVDPRFELTPQNSGVDYLGLMDAGSYLSAADAYGSPAYSEAELATAPEAARVSAHMVSAAILQPTISPAERVTTAGCTRTALGHGPAVQTVPRSSMILVAGPGRLPAALRRYASESFPVALGSLARGTQQLQIPPDPSPRRWVLELTGTGAVTGLPDAGCVRGTVRAGRTVVCVLVSVTVLGGCGADRPARPAPRAGSTGGLGRAAPWRRSSIRWGGASRDPADQPRLGIGAVGPRRAVRLEPL